MNILSGVLTWAWAKRVNAPKKQREVNFIDFKYDIGRIYYFGHLEMKNMGNITC